MPITIYAQTSDHARGMRGKPLYCNRENIDGRGICYFHFKNQNWTFCTKSRLSRQAPIFSGLPKSVLKILVFAGPRIKIRELIRKNNSKKNRGFILIPKMKLGFLYKKSFFQASPHFWGLAENVLKIPRFRWTPY